MKKVLLELVVVLIFAVVAAVGAVTIIRAAQCSHNHTLCERP